MSREPITEIEGAMPPVRPSSDDIATVVTKPRSTTPLHEPSGSLPGPERVLHTAEIEQTRRTAISGVLFTGLGLASVPFVGGDPTARLLFVAALVGSMLNNAWMWYVTASRHYHERKVLVYFGVAPVLNAGILYYLGVYGPGLVVFVLNVYSNCLGYGRRVALVTLVGSIVPFVVLAAAMTIGWIDDPGLMTATAHIGTVGRIVVIVGFSVFLCLVYAQARAARALVVDSLVERDAAVRRASHREALFIEARQDLERALQAGGFGRFTDQTLGSFRLGAVLGRGGMGEVYEATHVSTGAAAAVKLLLPEVLGRPEYVRRFLRELRIAASLDSPHIVRVLEIGEETAALPYLAMERLDGEDLAQILRREERLEPAAVVDLVRQVGIGLGAAAAAGIVHRDLKPQNLFLVKGGTWKILDFGVSKLLEHGSTLTEGETVGSPQYMAPEQARAGEVGPSADLYALGAIAYRALTGQQPFNNGALAEILVSTLSTMPIRPSSIAQQLPRQVDAVLAIAMAKQPTDRFDSAETFAAALEVAVMGKVDDVVRKRATKLLAALPWAELEPLAPEPTAKHRLA